MPVIAEPWQAPNGWAGELECVDFKAGMNSSICDSFRERRMFYERIKLVGCVVPPNRQEDLGSMPRTSQPRRGGVSLLPKHE